MSLLVPTTLSEEQTVEFQKLIKSRCGRELSRIDAEKAGLELIEYITAVIDDDL